MIRFFASHRTASHMLMLLLIALGASTLPQLRRETLPHFTQDKLQVSVVYPGATADDVEDAVCRRIEDALERVNNVEEMASEAREGVGTVTVTMIEGADFQRFLDEVRTEVDAIDDLPELTEEPTIRELNRTDQVVSVAVTGPMSVSHLKAYCEELKERLQRTDAVSQVTVQGFSEHQIRIEPSAQVLRELGLSVSDLARVVSQQSVDLPAGIIETTDRDVLVRFTDERRRPRDFEDLIVAASSTGAEVRLGDIAAITDRFELDEEKILLDGQRAGLLQITKTRTEDVLNAFDAVQAFAEAELRTAPPGVRLILTQDAATNVRDRLEMLFTNGWQGLLLVFLVMWAFFAFRFSFWVALGLPVSFLGAMFFLPLVGLTINMLTTVGLLVGIGLLMDDAIVISENIAAHVERGEAPLEAVVAGTNEVKMGVLYSFLTTICVFVPLAFLSGTIGKVLRPMPIILVLVLSVSLVEAFLILPHHLAHSLAKPRSSSRRRLRHLLEAALDGFRDKVFARIVAFAIAWRYLCVGLAAAVFIVSVAMIPAGVLKFRAFPDIEGDTLEARVLLPQGTPLARCEAVVARITAALERVNAHFKPSQPGGQDLVLHVNVQYSKNADAFEAGPHVATVAVDLLGAEIRNAGDKAILARWRQEVGTVEDVLSLKFAESQVGPGGRAIDVTLQGDNLAELERGANEALAWLAAFRGVYDLSHDLRPGKPEIRLRLSEGAKASGLDAQAIASQLRAAFHGATAREIQVGREAYEIDVRLAPADQDSLADLEEFHVTLPDGTQAPLGAVTTMEPGRSYARIARLDNQRSARIQGEVDTRVANTREVLARFRSEFAPAFLQRHPSLHLSFEGEAKEARDTQESMLRMFLLGVLGIYLLLGFQFRSYIEPLIVMMAIPFAVVGVIWGHILMGLDFSMPSMLGFVSLSGIVVNDSILLVEFVKLRRRQGMGIAEAATRASRERFRAVLLTSLTTVAGLLPILSERSIQAQILTPIATSLVFGLLASTLLILILLPVSYTILDDLGAATINTEAQASQ